MVYSWKRTLTASLLNETHFGFQRMHASRRPPSQSPSMPELGVRLPLYLIDSGDSVDQRIGYFTIGDNPLGLFVRNGFEFNNRTSWNKGNHSMQFGAEAQYLQGAYKQ